MTHGSANSATKWLLSAAVFLLVGIYVGSYFLCVSQVRFGFTRGSHVSLAPVYRHAPGWFDAPAFFRPIHFVDREYLRHAVWQDSPARNGELSGNITGPRQVLFSIPVKNAP
jgi:hypothetical protein